MTWRFLAIAVLAFVVFLGMQPMPGDTMQGHTLHGMSTGEMAGDPLCLLYCLAEATTVDETVAMTTSALFALVVAAVAVVFVLPRAMPMVRPVFIPDPGRMRRLLTTCKRE